MSNVGTTGSTFLPSAPSPLSFPHLASSHVVELKVRALDVNLAHMLVQASPVPVRPRRAAEDTAEGAEPHELVAGEEARVVAEGEYEEEGVGPVVFLLRCPMQGERSGRGRRRTGGERRLEGAASEASALGGLGRGRRGQGFGASATRRHTSRKRMDFEGRAIELEAVL